MVRKGKGKGGSISLLLCVMVVERWWGLGLWLWRGSCECAIPPFAVKYVFFRHKGRGGGEVADRRLYSIHDLGAVSHIEDIVVRKDQQGKKLGLRIIEALDHLSKEVGCYKVGYPPRQSSMGSEYRVI